MAFDVEGALRAGYSLPEIVDYLGQQKKFDVTGAREAGYSNSELLQHLTAEAPKTTIGGQVKEFLKAIPSGAVGLGETAITGASALLPEEYEKAVRESVASGAATLKKPFEAAPGYEDTVGRKLGTAVGSTIPFFAAGPFGLAGRLAGAATGVAAGAGEARVKAEEKGATGEERALATALGIGPGLLDVVAPELNIGKTIITRALLKGGVEGATEAAQNVAQNLIAKGIYNPEQPLFEGTAEEGAYGAGAGALASLLVDMVVGRKGSVRTTPPPPTPAASTPAAPDATRPFYGVGIPDTYAQAVQEVERLKRLQQTDEVKARIAELETFKRNLNIADIEGMRRQPMAEQKTLEDQIRNQSQIQGEFREMMDLPTREAAPEPEAAPEKEFPTVLDADTLAATGLAKQSGLYKQLLGKDLTDPLDLDAVMQIAEYAQDNPNLSRDVKSALSTISTNAFNLYHGTQGEMFGPKRKILEPNDEKKPTAAQKKIAKVIEGKDLTDPAQAAAVREALTDYANAPNRAPAAIDEISNFLDTLPSATPEATDVIESGESVGAATEPSTDVAEQRGEAAAAGVEAPEAGGMGTATATAGQPAVGEELQLGTLNRLMDEWGVSQRVRDMITADFQDMVAQGVSPESAIDLFTRQHEEAVAARQQRNAPIAEPQAPETTPPRLELRDAIDRLMTEGGMRRADAVERVNQISDSFGTVAEEDLGAAINQAKSTKPKYRLAEENTEGMPQSTVQKIVDGIVSRWKNAPKITVVQDIQELPQRIFQQLAKDNAWNAKGLYDDVDERVYLIADNLTNPKDAVLTLVHESLGHFGIQSILGNTYAKVMEDIYNGNAKVREAAKAWMAKYGDNKHLAVEEVLAKMAEDGVYNNAMQHIFNAIRQFLRRIGFNPATVTDAEVRELLANAQRFVVAGGPRAEGKAAFRGKPLYRVGSDAFNAWFGNSVVRNPDGSPKLMYHGTARDIHEFIPKQAGAIFVTDDPEFAYDFADASESWMADNAAKFLTDEQTQKLRREAAKIAKKYGTDPTDVFNELAKENLPSRANIIPVYVSAQKPFDFDNPAHIQELQQSGVTDAKTLSDIRQGMWSVIESNDIQRRLRAAGFDGFYVQEGGRKNLAVYDSSQLKSPYNSGAYGQKEKRISYRRPEVLTTEGQQAAAFNERMKNIANEPEPDVDQTLLDRLTLKPETLKGLPMRLRQAFVDKDAPVKEKLAAAYNNTLVNAVGELRGDVLNEQAQEATGLADQLMRRGGLKLNPQGLMEVYDRVENGEKISLDRVFEIIIEDLGKKLGSAHEAVKLAHRALIAQRAHELNLRNDTLNQQADEAEAKGNKAAAKKLRDQIIRVRASREEIKAGMDAMKAFPEIKQAYDIFTKYNDGIIDFLVNTGRLSKAQAQEWKDNIGYVPWTRMEEETAKIESTNKIRTGNVHLTTLPKLDQEGSSKEIRNVLDNMVGHTIWAVRSGMKNRAAIKTLEQLPDAVELKTQDEVDRAMADKSVKPLVVFAYRDGERVAFKLSSAIDLPAFSNIVDTVDPIFGVFKAASTGLRSFVTHMPTFALSQLSQDTVRAMFLSGVKHPFSLPAKVFSNFYHAVTGGETDMQALGITGAYDGMPEHAMRKARERHGLQDRSALQRVWDKLEDFSLAADMAVRAAIYEQTMKETGDQVLAFHRAKEYINFKTSGNGQAVRILRQIVPFMNAYIQGMDILYRTIKGKGLSGADRKEAIGLFLTTGMKVAALSMLYAMLVGDDDDYKGLDDYERDNNFIIPGLKAKIPVPPEIGFLFKVIPERIYQAISREGTDRPVDATTFMRGMRDAVINAYGGVNLMPQLVKPAIEVATNYSFFTGNPIVGINMAGRETYLQFNDHTSELAKLAGYVGVSPMKIDHLIRGYLGTVGGVLLDVTDAVADPNRMNKPVNKLPLVKTFMYDDTGRGYKTEFYNFREDVDKVVQSVNTFKREGRAQELQDYLTEDKMNLYAMKGVVNKIEEKLSNLRRYRTIIANDPDLSPEEKRAKTDEILKMEKEMLVAYNLPQLKKMAGM